jgi:hypothetical protein
MRPCLEKTFTKKGWWMEWLQVKGLSSSLSTTHTQKIPNFKDIQRKEEQQMIRGYSQIHNLENFVEPITYFF